MKFSKSMIYFLVSNGTEQNLNVNKNSLHCSQLSHIFNMLKTHFYCAGMFYTRGSGILPCIVSTQKLLVYCINCDLFLSLHALFFIHLLVFSDACFRPSVFCTVPFIVRPLTLHILTSTLNSKSSCYIGHSCWSCQCSLQISWLLGCFVLFVM